MDRYDELLKLQREAVLNAEDEKTAIKELASEGYDMLIGRVNELAGARKDALKAASALHDYGKTVSEQAADVDRLQKIVLSYQGDDSEGMKSIIQKAKDDLAKAQEELSETEYDRYMADQETMLDTFSEELNEWVDIRLDNITVCLEMPCPPPTATGRQSVTRLMRIYLPLGCR